MLNMPMKIDPDYPAALKSSVTGRGGEPSNIAERFGWAGAITKAIADTFGHAKHGDMATDAAEIGYHLARATLLSRRHSPERAHVTFPGQPLEYECGFMQGLDRMNVATSYHSYGPYGVAYPSNIPGASAFPDGNIDLLIHLLADFEDLSALLSHRQRLGDKMRWKKECVAVLRPGGLTGIRFANASAGFLRLLVVHGFPEDPRTVTLVVTDDIF